MRFYFDIRVLPRIAFRNIPLLIIRKNFVEICVNISASGLPSEMKIHFFGQHQLYISASGAKSHISRNNCRFYRHISASGSG